MKPFLYEVAQWLLPRDISKKTLIFPNRRSVLFFTKHLRTLAAGNLKAPIVMPRMITVSDFYSRLYGGTPSDKVTLLLELYDIYKELYPRAEPLDDFIFWGDVILSDFSDVDKYLASANQLFTNVADFKAMQDDFSYLTDVQRQAIDSFLSHFKEKDPRKEGAIDYKERFAGLWNILLPLYERFREVLSQKGLAYEGMIYRSVAESFRDGAAADILAGKFPMTDEYVFIGLNALNECERLVMRRMRDAGLASFCWDYVGPMIKDKSNRSSFFMDDNVARFPMDWKLPEPEGLPEVNVVGVPSAVGQAKLLEKMIGDPEDTAVVLPEEAMLLPVLNSIPDTVKDVNVTMGMPLLGSRIHAFMQQVAQLQLHLRQKDGEWLFYHKVVWNILGSGLAAVIFTPQDREEIQIIKKAAKYYIPMADFSGCSPLIQEIFSPVVKDTKSPSAQTIKEMQAYFQGIIKKVAPLMLDDPDLASEVEFAKKWLDCIQKLDGKELAVLPATYIRLLGQLVALQSVPLEGEPLGGLQIMGPLETRALDFGTMIVLSCNDGVFPRHTVSSSFIPPQLRKAFELPTYEYQDSIWAYYFYRMICRAKTVWLLFDTRTEGGRAGEESRYIKQLQYHFRLPLKRFWARSDVSFSSGAADIPKPSDIVERLKARPLSASSLQNYLICPAKFYYSFILRLKGDDEVSESLDQSMLGNVYHQTMQVLYGPAPRTFTAEDLKAISKDKKRLRGIIEEKIKGQINSLEVSGRNIVFEDLIMEYVLKTLEIDASLAAERGPMTIEGVEVPRTWKFGGYHFTGTIDRIDSFANGTRRVVDYKTGKVLKDDITIDDSNAESIALKVFTRQYGNAKKDDKWPKIALQLFLYDMFVGARSGDITNCIYPAPKLFTSGVEECRVNGKFCSIMEEELKGLLQEMENENIPFCLVPEGREECSYCDFKNICGR